MSSMSKHKSSSITLLEAGLMSEQLSAVYDFMEHIMVLMNYAKDAELHKVLQRMLKQVGQRAEQLEKKLSEYHVALPPRPPAQVTITEPPTSISDAYVFKRAFNSIVWFLPDQMFCFKFSPTHNARIMFKDLLLKELDMFEELQGFGLRKNWLQAPPEYQGAPADMKENPTIMEAAHLWNRLRTRYDTLEFTNYMHNLADDITLKTIIAQGQTMLRKHIAILEKMAEEYSIPLPAKPPEEETVGIPLDATTNAYVFRQVLRGMQAYFTVHIIAFQHSVTPSIQKQLKQLIHQEIDVFEDFVAYGQLRGWLYEQPVYRA